MCWLSEAVSPSKRTSTALSFCLLWFHKNLLEWFLYPQHNEQVVHRDMFMFDRMYSTAVMLNYACIIVSLVELGSIIYSQSCLTFNLPNSHEHGNVNNFLIFYNSLSGFKLSKLKTSKFLEYKRVSVVWLLCQPRGTKQTDSLEGEGAAV